MMYRNRGSPPPFHNGFPKKKLSKSSIPCDAYVRHGDNDTQKFPERLSTRSDNVSSTNGSAVWIPHGSLAMNHVMSFNGNSESIDNSFGQREMTNLNCGKMEISSWRNIYDVLPERKDHVESDNNRKQHSIPSNMNLLNGQDGQEKQFDSENLPNRNSCRSFAEKSDAGSQGGQDRNSTKYFDIQEGSSDVSTMTSRSNFDSPTREVDALTELLMEKLNLPALAFGKCLICDEEVMDESSGCTALGKVYHRGCFSCCVCGTLLENKTFLSVADRPYCQSCYQNSLEICCICSLPIESRILRATGQPYHPSCFCCVVCGKKLDGIPFTVDMSNQIHCIHDFHLKFAPRCDRCKNPIVPEQDRDETVRVVALEKSYHLHCYRCIDCDILLSSESEGRGCYPLDDLILCKACNARRIQDI